MDFLIAVAVGGLACVIVVVLIIASHAKSDRSFSHDDIDHVEAGNESNTPTVSLHMKSSSHRIPEDPRFINIGKRIFHKSRDCWAFSEYDEWEACTEDEAVGRGLEQCPFCEKPLAFVYGHSHVYHTTTWCSESGAEPLQMFEEDAKARGFRKCKACQKRDGDLEADN